MGCGSSTTVEAVGANGKYGEEGSRQGCNCSWAQRGMDCDCSAGGIFSQHDDSNTLRSGAAGNQHNFGDLVVPNNVDIQIGEDVYRVDHLCDEEEDEERQVWRDVGKGSEGGEVTSERPCLIKASMKLKVLKASVLHGINGEVDQFTPEDENTLTVRMRHTIRNFIDVTIVEAARGTVGLVAMQNSNNGVLSSRASYVPGHDVLLAAAPPTLPDIDSRSSLTLGGASSSSPNKPPPLHPHAQQQRLSAARDRTAPTTTPGMVEEHSNENSGSLLSPRSEVSSTDGRTPVGPMTSVPGGAWWNHVPCLQSHSKKIRQQNRESPSTKRTSTHVVEALRAARAKKRAGKEDHQRFKYLQAIVEICHQHQVNDGVTSTPATFSARNRRENEQDSAHLHLKQQQHTTPPLALKDLRGAPNEKDLSDGGGTNPREQEAAVSRLDLGALSGSMPTPGGTATPTSSCADGISNDMTDHFMEALSPPETPSNIKVHQSRYDEDREFEVVLERNLNLWRDVCELEEGSVLERYHKVCYPGKKNGANGGGQSTESPRSSGRDVPDLETFKKWGPFLLFAPNAIEKLESSLVDTMEESIDVFTSEMVVVFPVAADSGNIVAMVDLLPKEQQPRMMEKTSVQILSAIVRHGRMLKAPPSKGT